MGQIYLYLYLYLHSRHVLDSMQYSVSHSICPTDLLHFSSSPHFDTFKKFLIYFHVSTSEEYTIKNMLVKNPTYYGRLSEEKL